MTEDRQTKLNEIAKQIAACKDCPLYEQAKNPVPGYGDVNAEIMFIGEGPGQNEDEQGLPFVGKSGRYLDYLLNLIGMQREQVFITNVVKHRPPSNRDPSPDEIMACKHYLDEQIKIIDPLVIATLGRFSMARYFTGKISSIHGQPKYESGRAYYPLFHPAAALRNPGLRHDMEADFHRLVEVVAEVKKRREQGTEAPSEPENNDPPEQLSLF